ncbi:MAG: hypothetical protein FJW30_21980 [Acidobacteria bacterium]|nr:hypothetical protein [Acidobacteriota bacterium]
MNLRFLQLPVLLAASLYGADSSLLKFIMSDARFVAGVDVDRAKDSSIGRKMMEELNSQESELMKVTAATGFDPRRDIREILVASPDSNSKNGPALVIIRGAFDVVKIKAYAAISGFASTDVVNGADFFSAKNKDDNALAFLDGTLALAGDRATVRAALQRKNATSPGLNAETIAKILAISQANDIWLVSTLPVAELSKALPNGGPSGGMMGGDAFKGIEQAALGLRFNADAMEITAETMSKEAKDATAVADVVRFLATMVQMNRDKAEMKGLAGALDAMKLSAEGRTTRLTISLPMADMERMFNTSNGRKPNRI